MLSEPAQDAEGLLLLRERESETEESTPVAERSAGSAKMLEVGGLPLESTGVWENQDSGTSGAASAPQGARRTPPREGRGEGGGREAGPPHLPHFVAEQDEDQHVEDQLRRVRHRVEVHEQHVGEEQQEGDVEDHVPGEDHKGGREEGHVVPQQ